MNLVMTPASEMPLVYFLWEPRPTILGKPLSLYT